MKKVIYAKTEPFLKLVSIFNGGAAINIENFEGNFSELPHGSPVEALADRDSWKLVKGFQVYESATAVADVKVDEKNVLGVGDVFDISGDKTILSIDRSNSLYDIVTFDAVVTLAVGAIITEDTIGKCSITSGIGTINPDKSTYQVLTGVVESAIYDPLKMVLKAEFSDTQLLKNVTNIDNVFV